MGTQYYEITQINHKAADIRQQSKQLEQTIQSMENIVNDLHSVWSDSAQLKFVQQFYDLKPELDSFCTTIERFAEQAEKHAADVLKVSGGGKVV